MRRLKVRTAAMLLIGGLASSGTAAAQVAKTQTGPVEGISTGDGRIQIFKGIPFAGPPVGDLRWQAPKPAAPWQGVRKAAEFGSRCLQGQIFGDIVFTDKSEDCLSLNIWTPASAATGKVPVMVWIHGGGFQAGAGAEPRHDGEAFARKGVVLVTFNYRLGVFGFLAHPELTKESGRNASGNYGLLDQIAALRWVQENIAAFGGDPGNVTIFGESAGSFAVSALMASPLARGLFHKAIGESGAFFQAGGGPLAQRSLAASEEAGVKFAESAGASSLSALRALSGDAVLQAALKTQPWFSPNLDGYVLPEPVDAAFAAGRQSHIPLLAGWNADEVRGGVVLGKVKPTAQIFTEDTRKRFGAEAEALFKVYPAASDAEALESAAALASDLFIGYSTWKWIEIHAKTGESPVYRYSFDRKIPVAPDAKINGNPATSRDIGARHAGEIEYVFGALDSLKNVTWEPGDRKLSDAMTTYWANFARTGDPNGAGLPKWPRYDQAGRVIHLDETISDTDDALRPRYEALDAIMARRGTSTVQPSQTAAAGEVLAADTPRTTVEGNKFVAPAGWRIEVRGPATILTAPEGDSRIALVDVRAKDADAAVTAAWAAYRPDAKWPLKVANDYPDKDGWSNIRNYSYQTSPNEKRDVSASAQRRGDVWTVAIYDMEHAVGEKRGGQVALIFGRLLPKGYERETFAGKKAHTLDPKRIAELSRFVESGIQTLGVPGASIGIVQDGKVVFAGGFGVREIGNAAKPDADTLYSIASNTKALTTLMLAKLLDEGKLTWDTPVTSLLPSFKLGDADTTSRVLVKHLICACTGLPRQDYEWIFEFKNVTPDGALKILGTMKPTSKFGEMFQYSNPLAGAAGFVGGHVAFPKLELGAAYDEAMKTRVFDPLGMTATTLDFGRALAANHAGSHAPDIHAKPARAVMEVNYAVIPVRPAGGAWSNVRDMLKYVQMELDEGALPGGKRYIAKDTLLARRAPQVSIGQDVTYGMGLIVETTYGTPVVQHGGDLIGYHSNMLWLPEHKVGAVILTNGDPGWVVRGLFDRKLLEILFDGRPQADADLKAQAKSYFEQLAAERKLLTAPAAQAEAARLAARYSNDALGEITVQRNGAATVFDFGEWKSEVASRKNPDGTVSFLTIAPGIFGLEFVVGQGPKPTLVTRDAQHEYVFSAAAATQSSSK